MTGKTLFSTALLMTLISLATPAFADNVEPIGKSGPVAGGVYVALQPTSGQRDSGRGRSIGNARRLRRFQR